MTKEIYKVLITYKMIRGANDNEVAETCVELPISAKRYNELTNGLSEQSKAWREIQGALESLTFLQGYNKLGAWSVEMTVED